jgi:hypothetical protein
MKRPVEDKGLGILYYVNDINIAERLIQLGADISMFVCVFFK